MSSELSKVAKKKDKKGRTKKNQQNTEEIGSLARYVIRTRSQSGRNFSNMAAATCESSQAEHEQVGEAFKVPSSPLSLRATLPVEECIDSSPADNGFPLTEKTTDAVKGRVAKLINQIDNSPTTTPIKAYKKTEAFSALTVGLDSSADIVETIAAPSNITSTNMSAESSQSSVQQGTVQHDLATAIHNLNQTTQVLNQNVAKLQQEISSLTQQKDQQDSKVCQLQQVQQQDGIKLAKALEQIDEHERRFEIMVGIMMKQEEEIDHLRKSLNIVYAKSVNQNLVFTGIEEKPNERPTWAVLEFLKQQMKINKNIAISKAYRVGQGNNRPIIIELQDANDKAVIFQNVGNLKDVRNSQGRSYFISEQLPDEMAESKRQQNYVKIENKKLPSAQQLKMEFKKGQLFVDNKKYEPAIKPPTIKQQVLPTTEERNIAEEVEITEGSRRNRANSEFISYAARVNTLSLVKGAYLTLKRAHPDSTHIMCAYRFPGHDPSQSYGMCDDGEFGGARRILDALKQTRTYNCVVFIVRYYGGRHIGPDRFTIISDLAKDAITASDPVIRQQDEEWQQAVENQRRNSWGNGSPPGSFVSHMPSQASIATGESQEEAAASNEASAA